MLFPWQYYHSRICKIHCKSKYFVITFCKPCKIVPPQKYYLNQSFCGLNISKSKRPDCWTWSFDSFPVLRLDFQALLKSFHAWKTSNLFSMQTKRRHINNIWSVTRQAEISVGSRASALKKNVWGHIFC